MHFKSLFLSVTALLPALVFGNTHYEIVNNCGISLDLYISGVKQETLASAGGNTHRDLPEEWSGFIYTDFNRGNADGYGTVRAGFYGRVSCPFLLDHLYVNECSILGQVLLHRHRSRMAKRRVEYSTHQRSTRTSSPSLSGFFPSLILYPTTRLGASVSPSHVNSMTAPPMPTSTHLLLHSRLLKLAFHLNNHSISALAPPLVGIRLREFLFLRTLTLQC